MSTAVAGDVDVDVVVLGSGLAGSIMATILARHGHSVTLLEKGRHPRMALGESLVPASAMLFWLLGHKHDVSEISTLAHLDSLCRNVAPTSGVKRGFGCAYHREGQQRLRPEESSLFIGPNQPIFREAQLYRADIDHYLVRTAVAYGVDYREETSVVGIEIQAERVEVTIVSGGSPRLGEGRIDGAESVTARYLVDAGGRHSPVAEALGLREEPCRLRHRSRSLFAHLRGVRPLEEVDPGSEGGKLSEPWSRGTVHHVFEGGWIWVIPFNNHQASRNDLVSVGLTVDPSVHPRPDEVAADVEFARFIERFPVIARQFAESETVGRWVGTDSIQYSSSVGAGERFVLLHHAYGFVDPLYARGVWRSLEAIDVIADNLLEALEYDDFSAERAASIDAMQAAMLDDTDRLVFNGFRSMVDYDTWTAWLRIWFADEFLTTIPLLSAVIRCVTGDGDGVFDRMAGGLRPGTGFPFSADLQALIDEAERHLDRVDRGELSASEARILICSRLASSPILPDLLDWSNPYHFGIDMTPPTLARLIRWGRRRSPEAVRNNLFDFGVRDLLGLQLAEVVAPSRLNRDRLGNLVPTS